jgi:hypothetical protein
LDEITKYYEELEDEVKADLPLWALVEEED